MRNTIYTRQFAKDVKRMQRQGKDIEKLRIIIRSLVEEEKLDRLYRDHQLIGN